MFIFCNILRYFISQIPPPSLQDSGLYWRNAVRWWGGGCWVTWIITKIISYYTSRGMTAVWGLGWHRREIFWNVSLDNFLHVTVIYMHALTIQSTRHPNTINTIRSFLLFIFLDMCLSFLRLSSGSRYLYVTEKEKINYNKRTYGARVFCSWGLDCYWLTSTTQWRCPNLSQT
jgi:hypothetical protein